MNLKIFYVFFIFLVGCGSFGELPSEVQMERIKQSKNFNIEKNKFLNQNHEQIQIQRQKREKMGIFARFRDIRKSKKSMSRPSKPLSQVTPDLGKFKSFKEGLHYIWFGHSTFLVNLNGKIILFDPIFSNYASPFPFFNKRFQPPAVKLQSLPDIDYIVISHDHYDHLDMKTIKHFRSDVRKNTKFVVPLGVSSHLISWGIERDRITELDWWEEWKEEGLRFIATESQHFSGRSGFSQNQTLWASWVVMDKRFRVFFSGDSGYFTHFKKIGEVYGPFDITFLENGQYNKRWPGSHMFPDQTVQAFKDLKGKKLMTVHWGMFDMSTHNWFEPINGVFKITKGVSHLTPIIGELVDISKPYHATDWWN